MADPCKYKGKPRQKQEKDQGQLPYKYWLETDNCTTVMTARRNQTQNQGISRVVILYSEIGLVSQVIK